MGHTPFVQKPGFTSPDPMHFFLEPYCANGCWIDPGYSGHITAQPIQRNSSTYLTRGQPMILARIYKYTSPVERPYGSPELQNQYQNSKGEGYETKSS